MTTSKRQKRNVLIAGIISMVLFLCYVISQNICFETEWAYEKYKDGYRLRSYMQAYNDNTSEIIIPAQYEGKDVVAVDDKVFYKNKKIKSVVIPDTVTEIGASVFKKCKNLENVQFGNNIISIGGECFKDCVSLKEAVLPDGITEIKGEAFMGCSSLKNVVLPENITEIRGNTFENCSSLESVEIPSGVERIAAHAFYGCSSLAHVFVPDTVKSIGSSAFRLCENLKTIELPAGIEVNERAFKESPTEVVEKKFSDKELDIISEELNSIDIFKGYVVHEKNADKNTITYIDGNLVITNSSEFAKQYEQYELIDFENDNLTEYLLKAKSEGCLNVVFAMYTEAAAKFEDKSPFVMTDPLSIDSVLEMVVEE